jgi:hypothetical protein
MTLKAPMLATALLVLATLPAWASCPPAPIGDTAAEIEAQQRRIVCLQNELSDATSRRQVDAQLDALTQNLQQLEMRQRMQPLYQPPVFQAPSFSNPSWP